MKRSLLALAALTAFAGAASAQSSVTLFGVVDVAGRNVDNGSAGSMYTLSTDGNASSRLGFRGVEDLGGGLRAGFWIEGALAADTGNATGLTFQRRSTISLLGNFGELRLGRDYTPTFWTHTQFDVFGTNGVGSQLNMMSHQAAGTGPVGSTNLVNANQTSTLVRANNTIGYHLPALGGLYGQAMVAAGEGTPGNKYFGGRIGYAAGPFNVAFAYGVTDQTGPMIDDQTEWNLGGSWNFGFMTLMGQYSETEYSNRLTKNATAGVLVPIGAGTIKASYSETGGSNMGNAKQIAVGYVYDLSKRTAVYAHYATIENENGGRFAISGGPANRNTNFDSKGYEFGVRHSF